MLIQIIVGTVYSPNEGGKVGYLGNIPTLNGTGRHDFMFVR